MSSAEELSENFSESEGVKVEQNTTDDDNQDGPVLNGYTNGDSSAHEVKQEGGATEKHKDSKHSSSSKNKDRSDRHHHSSSSKSKSHDKDRERDKDKDKSRDKDKHRSSSSHHKSSSSSKDKDREHKSKEHKSSSSSKDKEKHSSSSSKEKHEGEKSSRDKHDGSGDKSKDKDKHRSDKHKDKERDKDKERSKDKSRDKEKDKHWDKERDKSKEHKKDKEKSRDKEKRRESEQDSDAVAVKMEVEENEQYEESASSSKRRESTKEKRYKEEVEEMEDISEKQVKKEKNYDEDEEKPAKKSKKDKKRKSSVDEDEEDFKPAAKKKPKPSSTPVKKKTQVVEAASSPKKGGRKKKEEEEVEVWKWWEEDKQDDGVKWKSLEHKGPVFAPPYEPLPKNVRFYYDKQHVKLSQDAEEIATFYGKMLTHDYTSKEAFNNNFFRDWRKSMTDEERKLIKHLEKCDFGQIDVFFKEQSEQRKNRTKEEKKALKEENEEMVKEYGFCIIDNHKEKIGNFRIEPPGLFRGRGEHPKMGSLKKRVMPEDVIINCSKGSNMAVPPPGHKWKEVRHDNKVTWLATWTENVQNQNKYVMLNPSSKLKGSKDYQKYEMARKLHKKIDKIRREYIEDWKSKEMRIRQRAVALYFIDRLALRAGNEKDEEQADTVGCCSLRVEHITLCPQKDGKEHVVEFDFLGKDSIRYHNEVAVEKRVFKNLQLFVEGKQPGDDLFDRLNTSTLNKYLSELMDGLTAKVFRTYNASITLQQQLNELTTEGDDIPQKMLSYNRANRAVAILCNHQRAVPKSHDKSMENLNIKISDKQEQAKAAEKEYKTAKKAAKNGAGSKADLDKKKKAMERLLQQLEKLLIQQTDRDENKTIALGTSKLNYLDPRISVAWCKKHDVPIEKIFNKTQRMKFQWAIEMADEDYVF